MRERHPEEFQKFRQSSDAIGNPHEQCFANNKYSRFET